MLLYKVLISIFLCVFIMPASALSNEQTIQAIDSTIFSPKKFISKGYFISKQNQPKASEHFTKGASYYLQQNDTSSYLLCMIGLSEIKKRKANFNHSFDILWEILPAAKKCLNKDPLILIHRKLGNLYGLYGKDSLSLQHHLIGLEIGKEFKKKSELISPYFAVAEHYINTHEYDSALKYLDSCYLINPSKERLIYIDAYYGHIYTQKKDFRKADIYLKDLIPIFKEREFAFLAMVYSFQGDLDMELNQPNYAISNYKKSLQVIDNMIVHVEIKPSVLERLALLHFNTNKKTDAYNYLKEAKNISDSLFHTQSVHNKELFEIKTKFQKDLSEKEEQLMIQNNLLQVKDKASFRLKLLIIILIILTVITLISFRLKFKMRQMSFDKDKSDAILETRNKELTANALQIIEKEHAVQELLETIKDKEPVKFKELSIKYKQGNEKIWDDFHLRFTQTNNKFYDKLLELHPTLTPNDLKHCALIKLNFDSKEMSHILGISLHSVHMARSRVRKKLNLNREDSLSAYMASV